MSQIAPFGNVEDYPENNGLQMNQNPQVYYSLIEPILYFLVYSYS